MAVRLELTGGLDVLDRWLESAAEADRDAVFTALFAISDGSAFLSYGIFKTADGFLLTVRPALGLRIRIDWARPGFELLGFSTLDSPVLPLELDVL